LEFTETACAKINLHLEVLNKRVDGYHNIFSLMVSVDECDLLQLEDFDIREEAGSVDVQIISRGGKYEWLLATISLHENLVVRAARAYFAKAGAGGSLVIGLQKNIPAGAGLAGGSSDAAAMLRLLNAQMRCFKPDELLKLAATIGADVPYCLNGGCAICEGIGDIIVPLEGELKYWVLMVHKNLHVSTRDAYAALKRSEKELNDFSDIAYKKRLFTGGVHKGSISGFKHVLKNDFEEYAFGLYPELAVFKRELNARGADYAAMTGSGSSIVGLFKEYETMKQAEKFFLEKEALVSIAQIV
jgi:4-diphosphocytidyl-2-C-methyl-D-erythritol kinase